MCALAFAAGISGYCQALVPRRVRCWCERGVQQEKPQETLPKHKLPLVCQEHHEWHLAGQVRDEGIPARAPAALGDPPEGAQEPSRTLCPGQL